MEVDPAEVAREAEEEERAAAAANSVFLMRNDSYEVDADADAAAEAATAMTELTPVVPEPAPAPAPAPAAPAAPAAASGTGATASDELGSMDDTVVDSAGAGPAGAAQESPAQTRPLAGTFTSQVSDSPSPRTPAGKANGRYLFYKMLKVFPFFQLNVKPFLYEPTLWSYPKLKILLIFTTLAIFPSTRLIYPT